MLLLARIILIMLTASVATAGGYISGGYISGSNNGGGAEINAMALTDTIAVAVGTEMNIWYSQLGLQFPGTDYFEFAAHCDSGETKTEAFRHIPKKASDVNFSLDALTPGMDVYKTGSCVIASADTTLGGGDLKQVLFIGASHFADGEVVTETRIRFNTDGGTDITLIGTLGTTPNFHEGRGGWTYNKYMTDTADNPFWIGGRVDFQSYMTDNSFTGDIDYCVIQLGCNDAVFGGQLATDADVQSGFTDYVEAFIDTMQSATYGYPDCKIILGMQPPSAGDPSAIGASYGNWDYQLNLMRNFQKILAATLTFDGGTYGANVDVCNGGYWVDRLYGYQQQTVDRSGRNTTQVLELTDYLHPNATGYLQMADAYYSHLRWQTGKDAGESGANYMVDSWQFSTSAWGGTSSTRTYVTGQTGVDGVSTHASLVTNTAGASFSSKYGAHVYGEATDKAVVSVRIKNYNMPVDPADGSLYFRLQDYGDSITHSVRVKWTDPPEIHVETLVDASGIESLGNDWYRAWFYVDMTGHEGNEVGVAFDPTYNGTTAGDGFYIDGFALEFSRETPGTYVEKP